MEKSETLLKRWWDLKIKIKKYKDEEKSISEKFKSAMISKDIKNFKSGNFNVSLKSMTRTSISKNGCPIDVWEKYSKKSNSNYVRLEYKGEEVDSE